MGAELYFLATEFTARPDDALKAIQEQFLDTYDLPAMLAAQLAECRRLIEKIPEGDAHGLHAHYQESLGELEAIASQPMPSDFSGRVSLVRKLHADTGEGVGNILDVEGISGEPNAGWTAATRLLPNDLQQKCGHEKILTRDAEATAIKIHEWLGRGECVFFPLHNDADDEEPAKWCFVANTFD
ncbi:MAG: hypothetical protein AAF497_25825 [Planctomycetota bacterium]